MDLEQLQARKNEIIMLVDELGKELSTINQQIGELRAPFKVGDIVEGGHARARPRRVRVTSISASNGTRLTAWGVVIRKDGKDGKKVILHSWEINSYKTVTP